MENDVQNFSDKDMLCDIIATEKSMADKYSTGAAECTTAKIKNAFVNILDEEHAILYDLLNENTKRGWAVNETAEQEKIDMARQKFAKFQ